MQSDWNYLKKTIQDVPNITSNLNQEVVKGKNQQGRGHSTSIFYLKQKGSVSMAYSILEANMERLEKKLTRIQNKCKKFGCSFTYEKVGEEFKTLKDERGVEYKAKFILIEAEGKAVLNDWVFVASVQHTEKGNIINSTGCSIEVPERYYTSEPICEHCNSKRARKDTYIVMNQVTGEFKQVGKSCLKDFTQGMDASMIAQYYSFFDELVKGEEPWQGCWIEPHYDLKEFLCYVSECIRCFGYGNLYEQIYDMKNLELAHQNAKKGKGWYKEVKMVDENPEYYLGLLQQMLINKTYHTSEYQTFIKKDSGKEREIFKLPYFPDRICQWAILQIIEPILLKNFTDDTYSAIPGRGIHLCLQRLNHAMQTDVPNCQYKCIQAHTSQADWTPDTVPALFKAVGFTDSGVAVWTQPLGATDAYMKGDVVSHNDQIWVSTCDANVWEPGVHGWEVQT